MELYKAYATRIGITASEVGHLLDVSDITNFPHRDANKPIRIAKVWVSAGFTATLRGRFKVGVVTAITATNGDVNWFFVVPVDTAGADSHFWAEDYTMGAEAAGLSALGLALDIGGAMPTISTNDADDDDVSWQTDVTLANRAAAGSATAPAVGDLVYEFILTTGTPTIDCTIGVEYWQR